MNYLATPGSGKGPTPLPPELNPSIFFTEPGTPPIGPGPPGCIEPEPRPLPPELNSSIFFAEPGTPPLPPPCIFGGPTNPPEPEPTGD